jgi:hypothetical protein
MEFTEEELKYIEEMSDDFLYGQLYVLQKINEEKFKPLVDAILIIVSRREQEKREWYSSRNSS